MDVIDGVCDKTETVDRKSGSNKPLEHEGCDEKQDEQEMEEESDEEMQAAGMGIVEDIHGFLHIGYSLIDHNLIKSIEDNIHFSFQKSKRQKDVLDEMSFTLPAFGRARATSMNAPRNRRVTLMGSSIRNMQLSRPSKVQVPMTPIGLEIISPTIFEEFPETLDEIIFKRVTSETIYWLKVTSSVKEKLNLLNTNDPKMLALFSRDAGETKD